ncbi:MAG: hypothetical protein ACJ790_06475 [Myxococcaceae bacterium]
MKLERLLIAALLVLTGCADFETARTDYEQKLQERRDASALKKDLGQSCIENDECESNRCTDGFCRSDPAGPNQSCNRPADCASGLVCEPVADLYLCEQSACPAVGRLCQGDFACTGGTGCGAPLKCDHGVCAVASCAAGTACASNAECCTGFACQADGGCAEADAGSLPAGFHCSSAAECESGECGNNGMCRATAGSCNHIGAGCANNCCSGLECSSTDSVCCLGNARTCVSDDECCSHQCLDGVCAQKQACRQRGLPCADSTDCCTGKCDAQSKQCVSADAGS